MQPRGLIGVLRARARMLEQFSVWLRQLSFVMPGLVPGIHVYFFREARHGGPEVVSSIKASF
jgi:hypothetical protein